VPNFRSAASGQTDVKFKLWPAATGGTQLGSDYVVPMTNLAVAKRYTDKYDSVKSRKAMRINAVIGTDGSPVLLPVDGQAWLEIMVGTTTLGCDFAATGNVTARRRLQSVAFSRESNHSETCETCTTAPPPVPVSARAHNVTVGNISIPNNTDTVVPLNAEQFDTANLHDTVVNNSQMIVPPGRYLIIGHVQFGENGASAGVGRRDVGIWVCGAANPSSSQRVPADMNLTRISVSEVYELPSGGCFEMKVFQDSGTSVDLATSSGAVPVFAVVKLP
jgi:hypothetical protein